MIQYSRSFLIIILFIIPLILISNMGCSTQSAGEVEPLIEINDQLGREIKLIKFPERIISLSPSNTEILYALGLEGNVIAVTDYCNYPPEAKNKTSIGGFSSPNIEKIVALSPDLVLATSIHQTRVIPYLEERGIPVFALSPKTLDEVLDSIILVGDITHHSDLASALVVEMSNSINAIVGKADILSQDQRPKVLYITWHDPLKTAGSGTLIDELIQKAGGTNIAQDLSGHANITLETIIQSDPEVIIAGVGMGTGDNLPLRFVQTEPRLKDTSARKNDYVYAIDVDLVGRAGPRIAIALEHFARLIHPELFR